MGEPPAPFNLTDSAGGSATHGGIPTSYSGGGFLLRGRCSSCLLPPPSCLLPPPLTCCPRRLTRRHCGSTVGQTIHLFAIHSSSVSPPGDLIDRKQAGSIPPSGYLFDANRRRTYRCADHSVPFAPPGVDHSRLDRFVRPARRIHPDSGSCSPARMSGPATGPGTRLWFTAVVPGSAATSYLQRHI